MSTVMPILDLKAYHDWIKSLPEDELRRELYLEGQRRSMYQRELYAKLSDDGVVPT